MKLKKYNDLTCNMQENIYEFIQTNKYNKEISFFDNDMNYYEDFPCFYMLYEGDILVAFLSVFIPDSASCEIYFHVMDKVTERHNEFFKKIYKELAVELHKYELPNIYILFDNNTPTIDTNIHFIHSEYLMQYDLSHKFKMDDCKLAYEVCGDDTDITLTTFVGTTPVGQCMVNSSGPYALIHNVEVYSKYRGLGYGKETLYHTVNHLINQDCQSILLHVNSANTIAFTMYSHYGFTIKQQIDYWKLMD